MKPVKKLFIDARGRRHHLQSDTGLIWNRCLDDDSALGQAISELPTVSAPCATGDGWSDPRILVRVGWPTWVSGTNPLRLVQLESLPNEVLLFILRRDAGADQSLSQLTLLRRAHVPDMALDYILTKSLPDGDLNPDGRVRYNAAMIHRSLHRGDSILPYLCALPRLEQQGILRKIDLSQALESDLDIIIAGQYPQSASDPLGAWAPMSSSVEQAPRLDDGARTYALANPSLPVKMIEKHWRNLKPVALTYALSHPQIPQYILAEASQVCSTEGLYAIIKNPQTDIGLLGSLTLHRGRRVANGAREALISRMSTEGIE